MFDTNLNYYDSIKSFDGVNFITDTRIDTLYLDGVELHSPFIFHNNVAPQAIFITGLSSFKKYSVLDLSDGFNYNPLFKVLLRISKGEASALKVNYKYFELVFDSTSTIYDKDQIFNELLSSQNEHHFTDGYEALDKEYKAFKYLNSNSLFGRLKNWLDHHWWDYGYNKFMVIENSILYTAYVYWGLKIDLKELEPRKYFYLSIINCQYLLGIVFLAYIANYIITK